MRQLVLASGSSYRKKLLQKIIPEFIVDAPDIEEAPLAHEPGHKLALRLAIDKAEKTAKHYKDHLVVGADQVAILTGKQLTKPGNRSKAISQLREQSGKSIQFHTGLCVMDSNSQQQLSLIDTSTVHFRQLTDTEIEHYIDREQPFDCAGSFKSEGLGIALFERIEAEDPNSLIGLPLIKLISLLKQLNYYVL
jgi:7-methyl-GTP pyrophosphatase